MISAGIPSDNALLYGAPQLDFLRPEYIEDSNDLKKDFALNFDIDESKDWILFLSSFTYAEISEQRLKINENVAGIGLADIVPLYTDSRKILIDWFSDYLEKNLDIEFIYRPHPDELNLDIVKELSKKYKNFHIISYSSAKEWIIASDQLYTWYSTTVVEAQFIGKDCAILRPFDLPESFDSVLLKHGNFISTKEDFIDSRRSDFPKPIADEIMISYYDKTDIPASENIVNYINNINEYENLEIVVPFQSRIMNYIKLLVITFVYSIRGLLKNITANRDLGSNQSFFIQWSIEMSNNIASKDLIYKIDSAIKQKLKIK